MATPLFTIPQTQIHVESDYSLLVITRDVFWLPIPSLPFTKFLSSSGSKEPCKHLIMGAIRQHFYNLKLSCSFIIFWIPESMFLG